MVLGSGFVVFDVNKCKYGKVLFMMVMVEEVIIINIWC